METIITKSVFFTYLNGQATVHQKQQIGQWLMDPIHQEQYFTWLDEWERQSLQMQTNQEQAWETITNQLENRPNVPLKVVHFRRFPWNRYGLAVSLLACVLVAGYLFKDQWQIKTLKTQPGEVRSLDLPDGSQVILNGNSTLSYNRFHFKDERNIQLTGEAEFSVRHQKNHAPFWVHTTNMNIRVLGTRFVVLSRKKDSQVYLKEGSVQLESGSHRVLLKPGQLAKATQPGKLAPIEAVSHPAVLTAWQQQRFLFDHTPVSLVIEQINDRFNTKISLDPSLKDRQLSGDFVAPESQDIIHTLTYMLNAELVAKSDSLVLTPR